MPNLLSITSVRRGEDGGTGDRWVAAWGNDYDGSGPTVEAALADLIVSLGTTLDAVANQEASRG